MEDDHNHTAILVATKAYTDKLDHMDHTKSLKPTQNTDVAKFYIRWTNILGQN